MIYALPTIRLRRKQRFKQNGNLLRVVVKQVVKHDAKLSLKLSLKLRFNHKVKQVVHRMAKLTSNGKERKGM